MNSEYPGSSKPHSKPGEDHRKGHHRNTPKGVRAPEKKLYYILHFSLGSAKCTT